MASASSRSKKPIPSRPRDAKTIRHVVAPGAGARPKTRNARAIERRRVYLGEGLTLRVRGAGASRSEDEVSGEVIDLTPEGIGVAVLAGTLTLREGDEVTVEHTGRATAGLVERGVVRNVSSGTFGGREALRVGIAFLKERTASRAAHDRRRAGRFECSDEFPALAAAPSPIFFRESLHFRVREIGAGGMTASTSLRNKGLLKGIELTFSVNFNMIGVFEVRGRVVSIARERARDGFRVGIAWVNPPRALLSAVAEYLMLDDKTLTPVKLRENGLPTNSIERAVTYDYARMPDEYQEILALRLRAREHELGQIGLTLRDMETPLDKYGRHLVCRFGGRIIIAARVTYVGKDRSKSEYVVKGGHQIPDWLWEAGFLEGGAGQTDPEFQRAGLYVSFFQHGIRVAMQSGLRYFLIACSDELLDVFKNMGGVACDTREVEPRPGWKFRSHIVYIDTHQLISAPPKGKFVEAMTTVAAFVEGMKPRRA